MTYLKGAKDYMLMYRWADNLETIGYSDADFVGCVDSLKSTSGYIFLFASGAVSWKSTKKTLTATTTLHVEFVSFFEATLQGIRRRSFISRLRIVDLISRSLRIFCDNSVTVFMAKNDKNGSHSIMCKTLSCKFYYSQVHESLCRERLVQPWGQSLKELDQYLNFSQE